MPDTSVIKESLKQLKVGESLDLPKYEHTYGAIWAAKDRLGIETIIRSIWKDKGEVWRVWRKA